MSDIAFEWLIVIFFPPVLAFVAWLLGFAYVRAATPFVRTLHNYLFFACLGIGYFISLTDTKLFKVPSETLWLTIPTWLAFLFFIARGRYQQKKAREGQTVEKEGASASTGGAAKATTAAKTFQVALATFSLILCLIASMVEWEAWGKSNAHLWAPLLWTVGAATVIVLARPNRRVTVIISLRTVVVLGVIGAISHPSLVVLVVVGALTATWIALERFWEKPPDPLDLERTRTPPTG